MAPRWAAFCARHSYDLVYLRLVCAASSYNLTVVHVKLIHIEGSSRCTAQACSIVSRAAGFRVQKCCHDCRHYVSGGRALMCGHLCSTVSAVSALSVSISLVSAISASAAGIAQCRGEAERRRRCARRVPRRLRRGGPRQPAACIRGVLLWLPYMQHSLAFSRLGLWQWSARIHLLWPPAWQS